MNKAAGYATAIILGTLGGIVLLVASWFLLDVYTKAVYAALGA